MDEHDNAQSPSTPATNTSVASPAPTTNKSGNSQSPRPSAQNATVNRRSRKNSVQMACERCRRRKIKCSGLPGPCSTCRNLGTVCHDPGKKRDRAQSLLENRIQRLESFAALGRASSHSEGMASLAYRPSPSPQPLLNSPQDSHLGLHIQTDNLPKYAGPDVVTSNQNSPSFNPAWDYFAGSNSPACYSDIGPELTPWLTIDYQPLDLDPSSTPNPPLHKRSHTLPACINDEFVWNGDNIAPYSASAFSEIPSIEVTSPDCSRPQSPFELSEQDFSSPGIAIPYSLQSLDQDGDDDYQEPVGGFELPRTPPLYPLNTRFNDGQIDYYGDFLSPVDKPPTLSRRSSTTSTCSGTLQQEMPPSIGTRLHRSQTLPSNSNPRMQAADQERLNTTVSSPRTRNYLQVYFQKVHPHSPILNPATISLKASSNSITTYQILVAAAIGALIHHQSRSLSSPYVRLAMTLSPEVDFWSSISGLHCAILLAIYRLHEETLSFQDEMDNEDPQPFPLTQPLHPHVNLWLHTCQISATCIDLGLNLGYLSGADPIGPPQGRSHDLDFFPETASEIEMEAIFKNTFRVAYGLDKRVSGLKQRPRSIRDESIRPDLARLYMLETVNL